MKQLTFIFILFLVAYNNMFSQSNLFKFQASNLVVGEYGGSYEGLITPRSSIVLSGKYKPMGSLSSLVTRDAFDLSFSSFGATIEYRKYNSSQGAPRGLYIAYFVKYEQYEFDFQDVLLNESTIIKGNLKQLGAGIQLGTQGLIANRIAVDFYFLGLAGNLSRSQFNYQQNKPSANYQQLAEEIQEVLEDTDFFSQFETTVNSDSFDMKAEGILPSLRIGLSIGIFL